MAVVAGTSNNAPPGTLFLQIATLVSFQLSNGAVFNVERPVVHYYLSQYLVSHCYLSQMFRMILLIFNGTYIHAVMYKILESRTNIQIRVHQRSFPTHILILCEFDLTGFFLLILLLWVDHFDDVKKHAVLAEPYFIGRCLFYLVG